MNTEQYEILKNNVGILASNIINSCTESANLPPSTFEDIDWSGHEELEEIYKFAREIMSQMNITSVDHTKGIIEVVTHE